MTDLFHPEEDAGREKTLGEVKSDCQKGFPWKGHRGKKKSTRVKGRSPRKGRRKPVRGEWTMPGNWRAISIDKKDACLI